MRRRIGILFISSLLLLTGANILDAYAHGPPPSLFSRIVRIDDELFSDNMIRTGEVGIINGELSNIEDRELRATIRLYVTPSEARMPDDSQIGEIPWYYQYLSTVYPPFRDQSVMYFRFESTPNLVVLGPGESKPYEIKFYPLKSGVYHVHTYIVTDYGSRIARGQTVIVDGESGYTKGEVLQLFLPITLFLATIAIMTAVLIRRIYPQRWKKVAMRLFFVFKSSYEMMLLSGVAFSWLLTTYLPVNLLATAAGLAAALGGITVGSYFSAVTRSYHRITAIGTLSATAMFYFALLASGCSHAYSQCYLFNFVGSIVLLIATANSVAAVLTAILAAREQRRFSKNVH